MWGYHLIVDMAGGNNNVTTKQGIVDFVNELVPAIDMVPHGPPIVEHFAEHLPEAVGYSLVQLIETSAICGHFSDKNKDAYLDIFSCKEFDPQIAIRVIQKHFAPESINYLFLEREAKKPAKPPFQRYSCKPEEKDDWKSGKECSACGICCCSDAYIIEEPGLADWLTLHGFDRPIGVEQPAMVLVKKLSKTTAKIVFFEKCRNLTTDTNNIPRCRDYANRPEKCRVFPRSPRDCFNIPECSFHIGETNG